MIANKRVLMRDVAKAAGVSVTTVSLSMRNESRISPGTRDKVLSIAREMNYYPDPSLASLNVYRHAKKTPNFVSLITVLSDMEYPIREALARSNNWVYQGYWDGIHEQAHELGFAIEEINMRNLGYNWKRLSQILNARNCRCLIIAPLSRHDSRLDLELDAYSVVALGYSLAAPSVHRVAANSFYNVYLSLVELRGLGYKRPGLAVYPEQDQRVFMNISGSFYAHLRRLFDEYAPFEKSVHFLDGPDRYFKWIEEYRPDVVLGGTPDIKYWQQERRLSFEEVGFVYLYLNFYEPEFAYIDEMPVDIGRTAVDLLSGMHYHNERGVPRKQKNILVEGRFVPGTTIRGKPA